MRLSAQNVSAPVFKDIYQLTQRALIICGTSWNVVLDHARYRYSRKSRRSTNETAEAAYLFGKAWVGKRDLEKVNALKAYFPEKYHYAHDAYENKGVASSR